MTDEPGNGAASSSAAAGPRISVIGIGGAGGNAINNMIEANLEGVDFLVANTDAQSLVHSMCETKLQLGVNVTQGLGAGSRPELGQAAAEEAQEQIAEALDGMNMAFLTAGMGGGTGTGAAPVFARVARDAGVLTVGVVTKPFDFEGPRRMRQAEAGIAELAQFVDTLIVIPNQNLFRIADEKTTFADAFKLADQVLHSGVRGVTDLMVMPGLVNLDFADVRSIMAGMGKAVMGTGEASGDNRALEAAEAAISNPLLDDVSMKGARSVLINITGGPDLGLMEVDAAANRVRQEVDPDANIIFGSAFSDALDGTIRVSVIATGNVAENAERSAPRSNGPFVGQPSARQTAPQSGHASGAAPSAPASQAPGQNGGQPEDETAPAETMAPERDALAPSANPRPGTPAPRSQPRAEEEPLTLRLVTSLPAQREPDDQPPAVAADEAAAEPADGAPAETFDPAPAFLFGEDEPATADPMPEVPSDASTAPKKEGGLAARFRRQPRPVKTESTVEAFRNSRPSEKPAEAAAERMHFVVWEAELGARIYKVPEGKLATVKKQPHADRLKLFDSLDNAKAEASAIFKRVAEERSAKGLSRSVLEPTLDDLMGWDENKVPPYFL